jgi:hypothetical protein
MNKLTEIKERFDKHEPWWWGKSKDDMKHLISLLEEKNKEIQEKDKALRVFADEKSWLLNDDDLIWDLSDGPMKIACKALNTSSNNEGD